METAISFNQSSGAAGQIAQDIGGVNQAADEMSNSSSQVSLSVSELSKLAEQLSEAMGSFKI